MTAAATSSPLAEPPAADAGAGATAPDGWDALRRDGSLQFEPVPLPEVPPREPGWFEEALIELFKFFARLFAPVGEALGASWWWLQWTLVAAVAGFALVLLLRLIGPGAAVRRARRDAAEEPAWQPDRAASLALLEDADRLAAEGRFDAATHLLLQRSVGQIASVRPDWVEPSSTARELAALPALPDAARTAFRIIAEQVEASLFALRTLERADWEAARAAYAQFALARIDPQGRGA